LSSYYWWVRGRKNKCAGPQADKHDKLQQLELAELFGSL